MKKLLLMAIIAIVAVSANASVSITSVVTIDSLPVLDNSGTFVLALNYKGPETSQDGITFQSVTHGNQQKPSVTANCVTVALVSDDEYGYNQADLGDVLWHSSSYTDKGVDLNMNITGLDKTKKYRIQYMHGEPRTTSWAKYIDGPFIAEDGFSHFASENITFGLGYFENVLITVEASGSELLNLTLQAGHGVYPGVAGIVIHDLGPDDVSPEVEGFTTEETLAVVGIPMTYQICFSEEIASLATDIFSNAGAAAVDIDSVTVQAQANCYEVTVTPGSIGTLQLRLATGETIFDYAGNATTFDSDVLSDKTFDVLQHHAAFTTFPGNWNVNANWDLRTPSGVDSALISDGHSMVVSQAVPTYSAGLTLGNGSSLLLENVSGVENALSTLSVKMGEGSYLGMDCGFTVTIPELIMAGNGQMEMSTGTGGHDTIRQFGSIEGDGTLTIEGNNQNYIDFNAMNPGWSGGLIVNTADRHIIRANRIGCFGRGDVTVNSRQDETSATIRLGAHDVFAPGATLSLNGNGSADWNYDSDVLIDMQGYNSWVNELYVLGNLMPPGVYTGTYADWITGTGYLIVLGDSDVEPGDTPDPSEKSPLESDLVSAFAGLKYHILGYTPLTSPEIAAHKATIDANKSLFGTSPAVMKTAFVLVDTYDTEIAPLWSADSPIDLFDRDNPDNEDIHWVVYNVMMDIMDYTYTASNIAMHESFLDGKLFATSAYHPGVVARPASIVTHTATINASYPDTLGWDRQGDELPARKPTGTYLAPGTIVTVTVPSSMVGKGFQIRVGCHSWDLEAQNLRLIRRMDRMTKLFDIDSTVIKVANPLGGGIYIEVPKGASEGVQDIDITGAVRSPYYSYNTVTGHMTTLSEWKNTERHHPAPWADFQTEKYHINVPTDWIYNLDDPVTPMAKWDEAIDAMNYLMGFPLDRGKETLYAQIDVTMRGTAYHPGYPTGNDIYNPNATVNGLTNHYFIRGPQYATDFVFHEQGHAYLFDKFGGEIESAINLPQVYVWSIVAGWDLDKGLRWGIDNQHRTLDNTAVAWMMSESFVNEIEMQSWEKKYQMKGHAKFVEIARMFGWEKVHDYFHQLVLDDIYKFNTTLDNDDRIFRWAQATGVDIRPLMHFWGIHPDPSRADEFSSFTKSKKIYDELLLFRSLIPNDNSAFRTYVIRSRTSRTRIRGTTSRTI